MRYLILTTDYPNDRGGMALAYVRTRNVYYKQNNIQVDVINFASKYEYEIDGIKIHTRNWFKRNQACTFDLLICHASNIRNHYRFLKKFGNLFPKKVFFFHGHEVLKINKVYSKPYKFIKSNKLKVFLRDLYDNYKLRKWRNYFIKNYSTSYCIFVSNWMRNEFYKWVRLPQNILKGREYITYNSVGEVFEKKSWIYSSPKKYDYITIRANLDGSKYSVDIVNELAWRNLDKNFLLIGCGKFFNYYSKAPNITWINQRLNHKDMCKYLDISKCALMPTRTDAQGVMMCEMAAYGIPVITSDIPVCHEIFDGMAGIGYIDNENIEENSISKIYESIKTGTHKNPKYFYSVVCAKELNILKEISER